MVMLQTVEASRRVPCDMRKPSTYKKVKLSRNRSLRSIDVFPVRYEHHLCIKK
jgi:hypothetical protein